MSRFTTPLRYEDTGVERHGRQVFRILQSLVYEIGAEGSKIFLIIETDFETDFGSVPRFFWRVFPPWGRYGKAFVLHDWLYRKESGFKKATADIFMWEAMQAIAEKVEAPWYEPTIAYYMVSCFGHSAYKWNARKVPGAEEPQMVEIKPSGQLALKEAFTKDLVA